MFDKFDLNKEMKKLYPKNGYLHLTESFKVDEINQLLEAMEKAGYEIVDVLIEGAGYLFHILYK